MVIAVCSPAWSSRGGDPRGGDGGGAGRRDGGRVRHDGRCWRDLGLPGAHAGVRGQAEAPARPVRVCKGSVHPAGLHGLYVIAWVDVRPTDPPHPPCGARGPENPSPWGGRDHERATSPLGSMGLVLGLAATAHFAGWGGGMYIIRSPRKAKRPRFTPGNGNPWNPSTWWGGLSNIAPCQCHQLSSLSQTLPVCLSLSLSLFPSLAYQYIRGWFGADPGVPSMHWGGAGGRGSI